MRNALVIAVVVLWSSIAAADDATYQRPVKAVANFVDAPAMRDPCSARIARP